MSQRIPVKASGCIWPRTDVVIILGKHAQREMREAGGIANTRKQQGNMSSSGKHWLFQHDAALSGCTPV